MEKRELICKIHMELNGLPPPILRIALAFVRGLA